VTAVGHEQRRAIGIEQMRVATYQPGFLRGIQLLGRRAAHAVLSLRVIGQEHVPAEGAIILAGNHSSFLDGPLVVLVSPRPLRALAKAEVYHGVLGRILLRSGQIPVHRGRPDRRALHSALDVLAEGDGLAMFPEGTRGTGHLDQVQHGIAWLILHRPCPIVPVACLGTARALPPGHWLPRPRARVRVVFGAPFTVHVGGDPQARSTVAAAAEQIRRRLAEHLIDATARHDPENRR